MRQDKLKSLIEDLRLNHEFCPKEVILQAADELERLSQRTWVELTDEEIEKLDCVQVIWQDEGEVEVEVCGVKEFYRNIIAKFKEKNT